MKKLQVWQSKLSTYSCFHPFNKDHEFIEKVKGLWMVYSSKALHSYFEDNFFGHGQRGCNGVESEEDELGYVCWMDKPRATLVKRFFNNVVEWW